MTTRREFDDGSEQEFGSRREDAMMPRITAFVGGTFVGAVLGCAAAYAFKSFGFAGEEPPIRVKGGSFHLDLTCGTTIWDEVGTTGKKWKIKDGTRGKDEYDVSIVSNSTSCSHKAPKGKRVYIEYTTTGGVVRWVEIKAPGNMTHVTASDPFDLVNWGRSLMWDVDGHISKIEVDSSVCTFASKADLEHALLMDF